MVSVTPEWVAPVARVLLDAGNDLRVGGLNEQRSDPAHKRRGVTDDAPRNGVGAEQAPIAPIVQGVLERRRAVRKQRCRGGDDLVTEVIDHGVSRTLPRKM